MINLVWSGLLLLLLVSGCGFDGTPTRNNDFVPLTSITIVAASPAIETSRTIANGTSTTLTVIGNFSGLFTRDITDQATWASDNTSFAAFNFTTAPNKNRVTGVGPGSAHLTATVGNVTSAPYTLTVSSATVSSIAVTPAGPTVAAGLSQQFTATGTFSDTSTQDITFDSTWTATLISSPIAASVSNDPASKGLAKGLAVGTATINATFPLNGTSGSTVLTVTPAVLQSIAVTPVNSTIAGSSKTVNFTATGTLSDGTTKDVTSSAAWTSSATSVATITTGGVATTVATGTTTISAAIGSISGNTNLTVTALALSTLKIAPLTLTLNIGASNNFVVTATFADGSTQDVTASSSLISSNTAIATVSSAGVVTGVSAGTVTISGSFGNLPVSATVTVQ